MSRYGALAATIKVDGQWRRLTKQEVQAYMLEGRSFCPACRSDDIGINEERMEDDMVYEDRSCGTCNAEWTDAYEWVYIVDDNPDFEDEREANS